MSRQYNLSIYAYLDIGGVIHTMVNHTYLETTDELAEAIALAVTEFAGIPDPGHRLQVTWSTIETTTREEIITGADGEEFIQTLPVHTVVDSDEIFSGALGVS